MLKLDFGGNTMVEHRRSSAGTEVFQLRQQSQDVSTSVDPGTPFAVWTVRDPSRPGESLAIKIDPEQRPPDANQKSKFEINVSRQDDTRLDAIHAGHYVLKNGSSNYLGFAFKMDTEFYDAPKRWVLHFQVWQCCSLKTLPPLAFQAIPDAAGPSGTVNFAMIARNDDYVADKPHSDFGEHLTFADGSKDLRLNRGQWYRIILFLKPDPGKRVDGRMHSTAGEIDMWIDGRHVLHHVGAWGYTPDDSPDVHDTYAVKLGIYRAAQPTRQQIYFNSLRWGTDKPSVDPDRRQ
jgi:hypothetical protein